MSSPLRIADPDLRARVEQALAGVDVPRWVQICGPEGPTGAAPLWIGVAEDEAGALNAVRLGAVDAVCRTSLERLPIALEQAHRALRLRSLEQAFEISPDMLEITSTDVRYVHVNPAFERLFGVRRADIIGRTPGSILRAGTHQPGFYEGIERRLAAGRTWTGSMVARRGEGVSLQEVVVAPVLANGEVVQVVAVRRDLSTSWIEPLGEAPPERVRDHLERHAVRPWVLHSCDGVVADASEAMCQLVGQPRAALLGTTLEALDGAPAPVLVEARWRTIPLGGTASIDTSLRTARGLVPVEVTSATLRLGDAPFLLTVITDITERKRGEVEVEQARDAAIRSNDEKSVFLANMSHELRTPLNAIVGYTELLMEDPTSPEAPGDLERVRRAAAHLLGLVDDILDLSRIEARRLQLAFAAVSVGEVLREVADAVRPAAEAAGITLVVADDPGVELVTDRRRVAQVLLNLLGNACKFTRGGRVEVEVHRDDDRLELVVADDGPGLPEELLPRLFQPFERATSSRGIPGTGLGLAISLRLARALGGELRAERPEQGARFVLTLPA